MRKCVYGEMHKSVNLYIYLFLILYGESKSMFLMFRCIACDLLIDGIDKIGFHKLDSKHQENLTSGKVKTIYWFLWASSR